MYKSYYYVPTNVFFSEKKSTYFTFAFHFDSLLLSFLPLLIVLLTSLKEIQPAVGVFHVFDTNVDTFRENAASIIQIF